MIEIKRTFDDKQIDFLCNGLRSSWINVNEYDGKRDEYLIDAWQKHDSRFLASLSIQDFPHTVKALKLHNLYSWVEYENIVFIEILERNELGNLVSVKVDFAFFPNLASWKKNYSFSDYFQMIGEVKGDRLIDNYGYGIHSREKRDSFHSEKAFQFGTGKIIEEIAQWIDAINELHTQVLHQLEKNSNPNSIITFFDFPQQLKIPCEQYLLYFAQFLLDLGINATSNLKEEAGKILFSVTPDDDIKALGQIREALAIYLNLPSSPIVSDESIKAMRLEQQIENLKHSQKMAAREIQLAQKVIESQDKIIDEKDSLIIQKDSVIEQQNRVTEKITSKSIMVDSIEDKEELEEIFEGLKIGKSKLLMEQLGVHLNPATALKTVGKKILGKAGERKSILGLDDAVDKRDS